MANVGVITNQMYRIFLSDSLLLCVLDMHQAERKNRKMMSEGRELFCFVCPN